MRVLHCIPGMGGGGAERQLAYLGGSLAALGWEVHVAFAADGPNLARLTAGDAVLHRLRARHNHDPALVVQLARVIRAVKPDIVQTWFVQMDILGGGIATLRRVPWIFSERSSAPAYPATFKNYLRLIAGRRADAVVANSRDGAAYWQARAAVQRYVIPNAVPLEEIDRAVPAMPAGVPSNTPVILFVGRLDREKNAQVLIPALRAVFERRAGVAVLCGDGPLQSEISTAIAGSGLGGRVLMAGYVANVWSLMKTAALLFAPSTFEGRPNAVIEAMAARCPLVVSDIPAHREILDRDSAEWAPASDSDALAAALMRVLDDPGAACARAARARGLAEQWSLPAIGAAYDRMYREVITLRQRGSRS